MGVLKHVNLLAVAGILSGTVLILTLDADGVGDKGRQFERRAARPFEVGAVAIAGFLEADLPAIRPGADANVFPRIADGRFRDARFIRVGLSDAGGREIDSADVEGAEGIASCRRLEKPLLLSAFAGPETRVPIGRR